MTTTRTTRKTVTFNRPFELSGILGAQAAGSYVVEMDDELLPTSFPAYRRIATLVRLPAAPGSMVLEQVADIDDADLAEALARDARATP
jgi:hypothetical protein